MRTKVLLFTLSILLFNSCTKSKYCITDEINFILSQQTFDWLPTNYFEEDSRITFKNGENEEITFVLNQIDSNSNYLGIPVDCDDEAKLIRDVYSESISLTYNTVDSLQLNITMKFIHENCELNGLKNNPKMAETLEIKFTDLTSSITESINIVTNSRSTRGSCGNDFTFFESRQFSDKSYNNVYSNKYSENQLVDIYFVESIGVIAFIDSHGISWNITEN